jgi:hypothetical protein
MLQLFYFGRWRAESLESAGRDLADYPEALDRRGRCFPLQWRVNGIAENAIRVSSSTRRANGLVFISADSRVRRRPTFSYTSLC